MKLTTKILIGAWLLFLAGLAYALIVPVGEAAAWVLLPAALLGFPLVVHFAVVALQPLDNPSLAPAPRVVVDGVEYVPLNKTPRKRGSTWTEQLS